METDGVSVNSGTPTTTYSTFSTQSSTATSGERPNTGAACGIPHGGDASKTKWNLGMVAVGNLKTREVLASFYARLTSSEKKEIGGLFPPVLRSAPSTTTASARRRLYPEKKEGVLFLATDSTVTYLLCAYFKDHQYPQRLAFALLSEVEHLLHDHDAIAQVRACSAKSESLEKQLRQKVRRLLAKYDDAPGLDKTVGVLKKVEDVKLQVRENLQKVLRNQEDLEDLQAKSEGLSTSARAFHRVAEKAKKTMRWRTIGMAVIGASFLLACIALFMFFTIGVVRGR